MNDAPLSLVAEWSHRDPEEDAPWHVIATYHLDVESFLVWRYIRQVEIRQGGAVTDRMRIVELHRSTER